MIFKNAAVKLLSMRRFSLRTFLILVLLLGCGFGILARWHRTVIIPGDAQLRIQAQSGARSQWIPGSTSLFTSVFRTTYVLEPKPTWLTTLIRRWVHSEYEHCFAWVQFSGTYMTDVGLAKDFALSNGVEKVMFDTDHIAPEFASEFFRTPKIRELHLKSTPRTIQDNEAFFQHLSQAKALEVLWLGDGFLSVEAAIQIASLPNLTTLNVDSCTPETLPQLANCQSLEQLSIRILRSNEQDFRASQESEINFSERARRSVKDCLATMSKSQRFKSLSISGTLGLMPADLHDFCTHSQVEKLGISDPNWSPDCLAEIARLPRLESLRLYDLNLKDEHLTMLHQARSLKSLTIGPNVSPEAIKALRAALPNCKVGHY